MGREERESVQDMVVVVEAVVLPHGHHDLPSQLSAPLLAAVQLAWQPPCTIIYDRNNEIDDKPAGFPHKLGEL